MATATVTITFADATTILAADHNQNFTDILNFLNNNVVHVDGSKAMTGELAMGANKITGVADPTLAQDVATKNYADNLSAAAHDHDADYADIAHVHAAADVTSGEFNTARIPNLGTAKITSGIFDIARLPTGTLGTEVALGNHSHSAYLGISSKAADSELLDGVDGASYLRSDVNDSFTGDKLTFSDATLTEVIRISATQGKNHIVWSNNPYTNGVGDYQAYWDNDIDGTNVGWAISTTLSSGQAIKKDIEDYDVDGVGAAFLRVPMRSWKYDYEAMKALGMGAVKPRADTHHFYVADEVAAEMPWLVGQPDGDAVPRIKDGRPLQVAMIATIHHLARRVEALEQVA